MTNTSCTSNTLKDIRNSMIEKANREAERLWLYNTFCELDWYAAYIKSESCDGYDIAISSPIYKDLPKVPRISSDLRVSFRPFHVVFKKKDGKEMAFYPGSPKDAAERVVSFILGKA